MKQHKSTGFGKARSDKADYHHAVQPLSRYAPSVLFSYSIFRYSPALYYFNRRITVTVVEGCMCS